MSTQRVLRRLRVRGDWNWSEGDCDRVIRRRRPDNRRAGGGSESGDCEWSRRRDRRDAHNDDDDVVDRDDVDCIDDSGGVSRISTNR